MLIQSPNLQVQAAAYLAAGHYAQAAEMYEQLVETQPEERLHCWYLGLVYLLQGCEAEAQMIWTLAMSEAEPFQLEDWTAELVQILETEAERQKGLGSLQLAWVLRCHIREIAPTHIGNLVQSLQLSFDLNQFTGEELAESGLIQALQAEVLEDELESLTQPLLQVLGQVIEQGFTHRSALELAKACALRVKDSKALCELLFEKATYLAYVLSYCPLACRFVEVILSLDNSHPGALRFVVIFYHFERNYTGAIEAGEKYYSLCQTATEKLVGNALLLKSLTRAGGKWQETFAIFDRQKALIQSWLANYVIDPEQSIDLTGFTVTFFTFLYLDDSPRALRSLQNQMAALYRQSLEAYLDHRHGQKGYLQQLFPPRRPHTERKLRIAYVSRFMYRHSIGWLARWLLHHHDRDHFEVYTYHVQHAEATPFMQQWYVNNSTCSACFSGDALGIAKAIYADEIDILVDLDSITVDQSCEIMTMKPAPVQVSWLGLDASGLPTIDYYIADPYVLPEDAQDYYSEKLWRLPNTYIAVDGFEVAVPTLRREDLDIPAGAVVYLSSQSALKRYPKTARLQMQIIKAVPNSYFLIKGEGDEEFVKQQFEQIAEAEGLAIDRLRFLAQAPNEEIHRANLKIADIVLDTFPYNGATTTLETLWMGIPLVTRVGQQFAARNSYTMMINAGITEGIAWTDEEYVEWGVRLGKDAALRQQISWRLRQSRQTSLLWNGRQFAREMENAYEQMWQIHLQKFQLSEISFP